MEGPIYHIPENFFKTFENISKQNRCNTKFRHLETLAFLIGSKNSPNEIRISGLLFPDQKCYAYSVNSLDTVNGKEMPDEIETLFGKNKQILGWVHTHTRGVPCFFSSLDVHTQFNYQLSCSEFIGIVLELTEEDFVINKDYYKLTDEGMNHVQSCIVINQNKTLNHQHDFCNSDLCSDKLYQSINQENVFLVDETLDIHIAAQFEHFEHPTINDETSKNGEDNKSAKRKCDSNFVFEPKENPEEVLSKKRKIDISTHFQTIVDDPQHVICLTCSSKLSTYSLKSLKQHLSTKKHLKMLGNENVETIHEHQDEKKKPFKCTSCDSTFEEKDSLRIHTESVHEGKKPFKCSLCDKSYSQKGSLKMHIDTVHEGEKPHKCSECDESFSLRSQLTRHDDMVHEHQDKTIQKQSENQDVVNSINNISVSSSQLDEISETSFKNHVNEEHGNISNNLENHIEIRHDNSILETIHEHQDEKKKTFKCTSCDLTFEEKDSLKIHTESAHGGKSNENYADFPNSSAKIEIKISTENEISFNEDHVMTNINNNEKLGKYMCSDCTEDFSSETSFKVHFKQYHDAVIINDNLGYFHEIVDEDVSFKRKFKEPPILLSFSSAEDFVNHAVSEDSKKKVIETDVSLLEEIEVEVVQIQQIPKSNSLHNCTECTDKFSSEFNLMSHMGLCHTEINEFECTLCLFTATQQLVLEKHVEMCHKGRNWPNTEENMPDLSKFIDKCDETEEGESEINDKTKMPYQCKLCNLGFSNINDITNHFSQTHESKAMHVEENHLDDIEDLNNNTLNSDSETFENEISSETLPEVSRSVHVSWIMDNFSTDDENTEYVSPKIPNKCSLNNESKKSFMPEHEEKKHLNCTICDISFSQNSSLNQHNESVHEGRFKCSDCNNVFEIKSALIQHIESVLEKTKMKKFSSVILVMKNFCNNPLTDNMQNQFMK